MFDVKHVSWKDALLEIDVFIILISYSIIWFSDCSYSMNFLNSSSISYSMMSNGFSYVLHMLLISSMEFLEFASLQPVIILRINKHKAGEQGNIVLLQMIDQEFVIKGKSTKSTKNNRLLKVEVICLQP